jgi:hypothetical protein
MSPPVTEQPELPWHLAQINIGRLVAPRGDPRVQPFFDALDRINALAEGAYQALWWIPAGHRPTVEEGLSRLWMLDRFGPSAQAFTFKARFPQPGKNGPATDMKPDPWCVGRA